MDQNKNNDKNALPKYSTRLYGNVYRRTNTHKETVFNYSIILLNCIPTCMATD